MKSKTIVWKMDDGRNMIITGSEFSPKDSTKIPRHLRGNTFRGALQLTRHLKRYGPPKPGCDELEEMLSDDDDDDEILESFGEKERELKACTSCGEVGHIASRCTQTCLCREDTHLPDECPMRKITCFLCEGTGHVPKDYQLNMVLTKAKEDQRTTTQPIRQPMAVSHNITTPDLQPFPAPIEVISGSRSTANKVHESPVTPVSFMSVQAQENKHYDQPIGNCYNRLELGHHISKCPFPRPKKLVHRCFNCGETDHLFEGVQSQSANTLKSPALFAAPRLLKLPQLQRNVARSKPGTLERERIPTDILNVQPPPQRIIVKGTIKGHIVPPATASNLRNQHQHGKQC
uniref:CCHC-type domain-containing protein n=1 Tax=Oryza punctata TaxID=4537 RepID=A0A0E0LL33_ORYPU